LFEELNATWPGNSLSTDTTPVPLSATLAVLLTPVMAKTSAADSAEAPDGVNSINTTQVALGANGARATQVVETIEKSAALVPVIAGALDNEIVELLVFLNVTVSAPLVSPDATFPKESV